MENYVYTGDAPVWSAIFTLGEEIKNFLNDYFILAAM